jgi:hypothetical protein
LAALSLSPISPPRVYQAARRRSIAAWAIIGLLGIVASWVAFGPGQQHFAGSGSIFFGEAAGCTVFGIGAILIWIVLLAMVIAGVRRLLAHK